MSEDELRKFDEPYHPKPFETIVYGGFAIGILDGIFALVFYHLILGAPLLRIFQSVAAGVLGREAAFNGGLSTFLLGVVLHFVVAMLIATVYFIVSSKLNILIKQAIFFGLLYGMIAYLVMNYIVIPLSRADSGTKSLQNFVIEIVGHAFLVGLPVALIARRSAKNNSNENIFDSKR